MFYQLKIRVVIPYGLKAIVQHEVNKQWGISNE